MAPPAPPPPYRFRAIGVPRTPLTDLYHALVRWRWSVTVGFFFVVFVVVNVAFAAIYAHVGGVKNATTMWDSFCFSVQTMATIGYGAMFPEGTAAELVVAAEAFVGLLYSAMATGLVFSKFARPRARMRWTSRAVIATQDGTPALMIRVGNERGNDIVDAHLRVVLSRTEKTLEGRTLYRNVDLAPVRDRLTSLSRAWTIMHVIDETSPLFGCTPARLRELEAEITVSVVGLDDTTMQPVFSQRRYYARDVVFGARLADILSEDAAGDMVVDLTRFDEIEAEAEAAPPRAGAAR